MRYCLAIDQGTHASRALLFDSRGRQRASASQPVDIHRLGHGHVEQDPGQLVNSVQAVIRQVTGGRDARIDACGIATQRSTVLAWCDDGTALGAALSWQDVRAADRLDALRVHEADIQRMTGLPLSAHYGATKLRWLYDRFQADPRRADAALRLSPLASFLLFHLIGQRPYRVDHSNAQRTQLLDLHTLDWSPQLADWFGVPLACLPQCTPMRHDYGTLDGFDIPVTALCGDQNAALFGAGPLPPDTALVNLGSGAFLLRGLADEPLPGDTQLTGIACSDGETVRYLREATVNGAGSALAWAQQAWQIENLQARLPAWLETIDAPPVFINAIGGLAAPWWRQDLGPHFLDDGERAGVEARTVAVVESIVFMVQANLALMALEAPLRRLRVSGGLSRLDGLCRRLASLSGLPVERLDEPEATARGAAWLAAGCPRDWQPDGEPDCFPPRPDSALEDRYRRFIDYLDRPPQTV